MKIMHFIHGLNTGGAETLVKNYFLNFDRNKNDVVLLCIYHMKESPYEEILRKAGVRMIFVEDYFLHGMGKVANNFNRIFKYYLIRKIIKRESPDILHTHLPINTYVKFVCPRKNTVIMHTVHSDPKALWDCSKKDRARDLAAAQWLVEHRDMRFIALHERMREEIDEMFNRSDTIVLNNGVDVDVIKKAEYSKEFRKNIGILGDALVLGHIGRLSKVKNQVFLVDIFKEISKKNPSAFLLMVGDGPDKNKITKKLDNAGFKDKYLILSNRDDVPDLLNIMDAFVFPSLYEGLPLSLVEAQIARIPCFVSDKVNESAIISNLVTRISLRDSAEKWADMVLSYEKPKRIMVKDADWDIKKITKKLERIYLDALTEQRDGKK